MSELQVKKRIEWVDTAKGIGLLLVIWGHLHVPLLTTWIYTFHMPLFFFLSGFVFSGEKYSFKKFLNKRIHSLVIPYFSLGIVIWFFYVIVNFIVGEENGLYGSNREMLWNLLKQEHFWTIWFLACLFVVEIIYYWTNKLFGKSITRATIILVMVCVLGLSLYHYGCDGLPWNIDVALVAQFFFHIGYLLRKNSDVREKILNGTKMRSIALASLLLLLNGGAGILSIKVVGESLDMSVGLYGDEVLTMISALAGILFVVIVSNKVQSKILIYLGQNTMILFAWHSRIVIVLCGYIYRYFGILQGDGLVDRICYSIVTFSVILLVLIPVNEWIKKCRFHKVFGV